MYLIKSVIFNFARRLKLISSIIVGTIKDILKVVLYPLSLPLKLLLNLSKRRRFERCNHSQNRRYDDDFIVVDDNPDDKSGLNHKLDNYQSQIDMLTRKINECELSQECQSVRINKLDKLVDKKLISTKLNGHILTLREKVEDIEKEVKQQGSWILKSGKNRLKQLSDRINNQLELINDNEVESFQRVNKLGEKVEAIEGKISTFFKFNKTMVDRVKALEDDYKYLNGRMDKLRQTSGFVLSINSSLKSLKEKVETIQHYHIDNDISTKIEALEAKVDKLLSENSELTFKPLTKEEEVSLDDLQARLEMSEGEAQWYKDGEEHYKRIAKDEYAEHKANYPDEPDSKPDRWGLTKKQREEFRNGVYKRAMGEDVKKYPSEPNFNAEKEAMDKQMAKVAERDDK